MATEKSTVFSSGLGSVAAATPWGAAIGAAAQIASTPNTSASGDISAGGATFGGVNFGLSAASIPWYGYVAVAAVALVLILRRK